MFVHQLSRIFNRKEERKKQEKVVKVDEDGFEISSEEDEEEDAEVRRVRQRFTAAAAFLPSVAGQLDQAILLQLYGAYKLAIAGPPDESERPSIFQQKERAKFSAWQEASTKYGKKEAMETYASILESLNVGFDPDSEKQIQVTNGGFGLRVSRPVCANAPYNPPYHPNHRTQLIQAVKANDLAECTRIIDAVPTLISAVDNDNMTALHHAVDNGFDDIVVLLLRHDPPLDIQDADGNTALHIASITGRFHLAQLLLAKGANENIRNDDNELAAVNCPPEKLRAVFPNYVPEP